MGKNHPAVRCVLGATATAAALASTVTAAVAAHDASAACSSSSSRSSRTGGGGGAVCHSNTMIRGDGSGQEWLVHRSSLSVSNTCSNNEFNPHAGADAGSFASRVIPTLRGGASHGSNSNSENNSEHDSTSHEPFGTRNKQRRTSKEGAPKAKTSTTRSTPNNKKASSPVVDEILQEEDYYKILGTTKDEVSQAPKPDTVIQKAYRRRAVQTHPDKTGGDRRAFDKVAEAYEGLQDAEKRRIYDRYGKTSAGNGGMGGGMSGMGADDILRSFFGSGGGTSPFASFGHQHYHQQQHQRNRSMRFELEVTLEDLYRGKSTTVLLPGHKKVSVTIPRGAFHNQQIFASGVMDSDANHPPGDAHFSIKQRPHAIFTRKGHDLAVQLEISLAEAVTGVRRQIRHLDGRILDIVSAAVTAGNSSGRKSSAEHTNPAIIATGDVHVLKGEGMPKDALATEFGDLYIQYQVNMPMIKHDSHGAVLTETERHELKRLLNKLEGIKHYDSLSSHWPFADAKDAKILRKASLSDFGRSGGGDPSSQSFEGYEEDSGFSPFGDRRFYWSSSSSSAGPSTNPFFGPSGPHGFGSGGGGGDADDENSCRQM